MLKELDGNHSVVRLRLKPILHDISSDDSEIVEPLRLRNTVNVLLLRARIRKRCDFRIRKHLSEVEGC